MSTRLLDTFVGVNGTALAAHTPNVGGPWTSGAAGWEINSNKLRNADAAGASWAPFGRRTGKCVLTFQEPTLGSGKRVQLWLKGSADDDNYASIWIHDDGLNFKMRVASAASVEFTAPIPAFTATGNTLSLAVNNAEFEVRANNRRLFTWQRTFAPSWVFDRFQLEFILTTAGDFVGNSVSCQGLGQASN